MNDPTIMIASASRMRNQLRRIRPNNAFPFCAIPNSDVKNVTISMIPRIKPAVERTSNEPVFTTP